MNIRLSHIVAAASLGLLGLAPPDTVRAQTAVDTFNVSITIQDDCSVTAANLNFGTAAALDTNIDVNSTITVNCTVGTAYSVSLDQGTNVVRLMSDGLSQVDYELYTTALRDTPWGTTVGVDTVGGTGDGTGQALTVYGRVPTQVTPTPSTYTDTITATVAF